MAKLLYIMGTGRSGTTILEVLLSAGENVFGVGELTHIFRDGFLGPSVCSCGEQARTCPFWRAVGRASGLSHADMEAGERINHRLEKHSSFTGVALGLVNRGRRAEYERINGALLDSVCAVSGAEVVVDSSKYAGRALLLSRIDSFSTHIVLITREPSGLLAAFRKPNKDEQMPKGTFEAALYYIYTLACFTWVKRQLAGRVLTISYERLMADPVAELERIQTWAGIDLSVPIKGVREGRPFQIGHIVTGNRLRYKREVRFAPSVDKTPGLSGGAKVVAHVLRWYRAMLGLVPAVGHGEGR